MKSSPKSPVSAPGIDPIALAKNIFYFIARPTLEIYHGIRRKNLPWGDCIATGSFLWILVLLRVDVRLMDYIHLGFLYPDRPLYFRAYWISLMVLTVPGWAYIQVYRKNVIAKKLQEAFIEAGLKSKSGRFPQIISDWPIDAYVRRLRLTRAGLPESQFKEAKPTLESGLGVYIDEIREHRESGLIDILYALAPMDTEVKMESVDGIPENSFQVGMARAHAIFVSLLEIPHSLIGGQSGGGKSTFLRQVIVTLYLRNPRMSFSLIDLKDRLEFGLFEGLKRVHVDGDVAGAARTLERVAQDLDKKTELLRTNGCKDIEAYQKLPVEKRKYPPSWPAHVSLERHMVIIDEAYGLFRVGLSSLAEDVQTARESINKIAQKGRAVGIHLIVGTQRPDKNAVDPQTKANLAGRLCFKMADNASSMTILDNGRATDLPIIPGRAIWQAGLENLEVQAPLMTTEKAKELIAPHLIKPRVEDQPDSASPSPKPGYGADALDSVAGNTEDKPERKPSMGRAVT